LDPSSALRPLQKGNGDRLVLGYRFGVRAFVLRLLLAAGPAPGFPGLSYVTSCPEAKARSV